MLVVAMDTTVDVVVGVVSVAVVFKVLPIFICVAALCVVNEWWLTIKLIICARCGSVGLHRK